jgi:type IV pilus assembly protein PilY1
MTGANMKISHWVLGAVVVGSTLAVGPSVVGQSVPGALTIATEPLFLKGQIKPAFIMAVDDSGSMNLETLFETRDGALYWGGSGTGSNPYGFYTSSGANRDDNSSQFSYLFNSNHSPRRDEARIPPLDSFGMARSHEFNPGYYNPGSTYLPWRKALTPHWPDAAPTAAQTEPRSFANSKTSPVFDLTANMRDMLPASTEPSDTNPAEPFDFRRGMVIPAGTVYRDDSTTGDPCSGVADHTTFGSETTDQTVDEDDCKIWIEYFPATYFLTTSTSPDGNTAGTLISSAPGGKPGLYKYEIKPGNYADAAAYANAIQNFANWFQYYRNRRLATVAAMTHSLELQRDMRVGYFQINDYASATPTMQDLNDPTMRAALFASITDLSYPPVGAQATPNRQAVARIGQQFDTRTGPDAPIVKACQINAGMLFTDGYSNDGGSSPTPGDNALGAPFADTHNNTMADIAAHYYNKPLRSGAFLPGKVPVPPECSDPTVSAAQRLKLDCRAELHMNFYGITLGALADRYGKAPYVDNPATTNVDEAYDAAFATPPAWAPAGNDNPEAVDEIWHATINARGGFINATNPQAVTNAMRKVLQSVADKNPLFASQSVTGARLSAGSFNVTPTFGRRRGGKDWFGTLAANRINPTDGSNGAQLWEAATKLDALGHAARNVWTATSNVDSTNRSSAVVAFNVGGGLSAASVGVSAAVLTGYGVTEQQLFDYLRGATTHEGTALRGRSTRLGDIVNSTPQIAAAKDDYGWAFASGLPATVRDSYTTYLTTNGPGGKKDRQSFVYVGANDGMLHAFEGDQPCTILGKPAMCTPASAGTEAFAYVPNAVLNKVGLLANPDYGHQYYVDGSLAVGDVHTGTSWKTLLVGGLGAGGRGAFGLDVSDPSNFGANDVLWEVNASVDGDIGHVMGEPVIAPINYGGAARWVALFGNGYNSSRSEPALFMVDVMTGAVLEKIVPNDNDATNANGLGNIAAIDNDNDGLVDTVYGGDLLGNLWKFELSGSNWGVAFSGSPLFKAENPAGTPQPISGGLEVSTGPGNGVSVFFGTGRYFVDGDNTVGTAPPIQSFYGIWDNGTPVTGARGTVLQAQSIIVQSTSANPAFRTTTTNGVNYATKRGWFLDLRVGTAAGTGERFIGMPRLQSGKVFFTTFEPMQDECDPDGRNWLYSLDAVTGAAGMSQISQSPTGQPPICTGSDCGGIALSNGGPVRDTSFLLPPPLPLPGLVGGCVPGTPGCTPPTTPTHQRCTLVIRAPGVDPLYYPRACGRQSWRQIR